MCYRLSIPAMAGFFHPRIKGVPDEVENSVWSGTYNHNKIGWRQPDVLGMRST